MQFLARLEPYCFARRDTYLRAGAGIAADPGLACPNAENAKPAQFYALTGCQGLFQALKHSIDRRLGFRAGQACALDHMVDDILFNQSGHLAGANCFRLYHALPG